MSMITDDNGLDKTAGVESADEPAETQAEVEALDAPQTAGAQSTSASRLALRDDGKLMISLENADDRDLSGREIIRFMTLNVKETSTTRALVEDALAEGAASIIGRLPRRRP